MRILGFGDNIVDRYLDRGRDYPGGNAVNVAVYARRLGAVASYLGVFGDDDLGVFLRNAIDCEGVETDRSIVRSGESGISTLKVVDRDRSFGGWNGGGITVSNPIDLDEGRLGYAATFDLVHSGVYSGTESQLHRLRSSPALVSFDFSSEAAYRTDDYVRCVAPCLDLALASYSDLGVGDARQHMQRLIDAGAALALGTLGERGSVVTDGYRWVDVPAETIKDPTAIVDTMGCGDAFLAGFVVELFGRGWRKGKLVTDKQLMTALHAGGRSAKYQCFVESAFGRGRASPKS
ncbi:PfkB family carbohydrate kinase [Brevibacterium sp. K11IcPPYGO002]|uniref:PfkB family carbohydrate kinase n=1 Tax=Brevibacterium sp. K11IcPPYGO002 TaxID=3058837 RepID=UPI003D819C70